MLVVPIGTAQSTTSGNSLVCTTSLASPAGNTVVFSLATVNSTVTATAVDSAGNSYTGVLTSRTNTFGWVFYCVNALALPLGGTITVTFSGNVTSKSMSAATASGITSVDVVGTGANGSSISPAYTASTLGQNTEICFAGTVVNSGSTIAYSEPSGWAPIVKVANAAQARLAYSIVTNGTSVAPAYGPTLGASEAWVCNIVTFKANGPLPKSVTLSSTSWTVPADFNTADNMVEVISGGGNGYTGAATSGGGGGGAGGYSVTNNLALTIGGSITIQIGIAGGTTGTTGTGASWFNGTSISTASVGIAGAASATNTAGSAGAVITSATGYATAGGAGSNGGSAVGGGGGMGGSGRAGAGILTTLNTGTSTTGGTGRPGDGLGGTGGTSTSAPSAGSPASGNGLSGGGGGGGSLTAGDTHGAAGGGPGAGGGGGYNAGGGGAGQPGTIVVTYTPIIYTGTITTTLRGISQVLSAAVSAGSISAAITTHLSGIAQAGVVSVGDKVAITTHLSGIAQAGVVSVGDKVAITTHLSGIAQAGVVSVGDKVAITTRLSGISQVMTVHVSTGVISVHTTITTTLRGVSQLLGVFDLGAGGGGGGIRQFWTFGG
jgi:hypothetical protein